MTPVEAFAAGALGMLGFMGLALVVVTIVWGRRLEKEAEREYWERKREER